MNDPNFVYLKRNVIFKNLDNKKLANNIINRND